MEYTSDNMYNETTLLLSLLNMFSTFQIRFWYNKGHDEQNKVEHIAIRCINCGKETGLSMDNINTKYKDIITSCVLIIVLHHVSMSCIIKTNKQLEYGMDKNNSDWIRGGSRYNTSICKKLHGNV